MSLLCRTIDMNFTSRVVLQSMPAVFSGRKGLSSNSAAREVEGGSRIGIGPANMGGANISPLLSTMKQNWQNLNSIGWQLVLPHTDTAHFHYCSSIHLLITILKLEHKYLRTSKYINRGTTRYILCAVLGDEGGIISAHIQI